MESKLKRQIETIFNGLEGPCYVGPPRRTRPAGDLPTVEWWRSRLCSSWLELHPDLVSIDCEPTRVQMFSAAVSLPATNSIPDYIHLPATGEIEFQEVK